MTTFPNPSFKTCARHWKLKMGPIATMVSTSFDEWLNSRDFHLASKRRPIRNIWVSFVFLENVVCTFLFHKRTTSLHPLASFLALTTYTVQCIPYCTYLVLYCTYGNILGPSRLSDLRLIVMSEPHAASALTSHHRRRPTSPSFENGHLKFSWPWHPYHQPYAPRPFRKPYRPRSQRRRPQFAFLRRKRPRPQLHLGTQLPTITPPVPRSDLRPQRPQIPLRHLPPGLHTRSPPRLLHPSHRVRNLLLFLPMAAPLLPLRSRPLPLPRILDHGAVQPLRCNHERVPAEPERERV